MKQRQKIVDLAGYSTAAPFRVTLDCAYWSLRITNARVGVLVDGIAVESLGVFDPNTADTDVAIDFPPVFDAQGRPIPWQSELVVTPAVSTPLAGSVILVYIDP